MSEHALLVPATGNVEHWHYEEPTMQAELEARSEGTYVELTLQRQGEKVAVVHVLTDNDMASPNTRARGIVVLLTGGVHIALFGNVIFTELSEQYLDEVLGLL